MPFYNLNGLVNPKYADLWKKFNVRVKDRKFLHISGSYTIWLFPPFVGLSWTYFCKFYICWFLSSTTFWERVVCWLSTDFPPTERGHGEKDKCPKCSRNVLAFLGQKILGNNFKNLLPIFIVYELILSTLSEFSISRASQVIYSSFFVQYKNKILFAK